MDRAQESIADRIAEVLKETEDRPLWQLRMVVQCLGADAAQQLLAETEHIEQRGGMLVPDGSRRRTPGGVFFALARKRLPKGDRLRIFGLPGNRPQKPREATEGVPESERGSPGPVSPRARRRLVEVSTMTQYRPTAAFRAQPKAAAPASHAGSPEQDGERSESSEATGSRLRDPSEARAHPRRIVTVADLKGQQQQTEVSSSAASAPGRSSVPTASFHSEEERSEGRQPEAGGTPPPPTPSELRQYITGLLVRQPATSRQRLLLDLLLEDLEEAPVAPAPVALPTRLTVLMAHRLGYSVEAIAQQVLGDGSQKARRRAEEILEKGVDFELLERLFELAARA